MENKNNGFNIVGLIMRLILSMIVVGLTNIIVPGMSNKGGFWNLAIIAIVIALIQHFISILTGKSKAANGVSGFITMALVLYLAGKFVSGFQVSILGALIGGLVYGLVDSLIPGEKLR